MNASYLTIKVLEILLNNYLNHKFSKFPLYSLIFYKYCNILAYITWTQILENLRTLVKSKRGSGDIPTQRAWLVVLPHGSALGAASSHVLGSLMDIWRLVSLYLVSMVTTIIYRECRYYSKTSFIGIFTYRDLATSFIGTFCFSSSHHSLYIVT